MAEERARLRRLDLNLRNSFSKIKDEMDGIRNSIELQVAALKELKKELEISKGEFVGIDKINVLKIKLGDLNEQLKAVERFDKKLAEMEKTVADKEQTKIRIDELKDNIDSVEKTSKAAATDEKVEKLIKEVNDEFSKIRKTVRTIEEKGGSIVRDKLGKLEFDINKKAVSLGNRINALAEELRKCPSKQEINQLMRDISKEFDDVKDHLEDIRILKNDFKTVRREKLGKAHFEQQMQKLNAEIADLKSSVRGIRRSPANSGAGRGFNSYFIANALIVLAFLLLAASVILFFMDKEYLMDYFIYSAVGSFMLGILTRIILVIKEK